MALKNRFCVEWVNGTKIGRRGLAWLVERPVNETGNVKADFNSLGEGERRNFRSRFDAWIDGLISDRYFHGWNEEGFRNCFVFKYRSWRIFGFLCNPKPQDKSFQMCVLASMVAKHEHEADMDEKRRMVRLSKDSDVQQAASNPVFDCNTNNFTLIRGGKK